MTECTYNRAARLYRAGLLRPPGAVDPPRRRRLAGPRGPAAQHLTPRGKAAQIQFDP